nr:MAG TPA: hypothetical protein [Caudoviricetes sp.]
MMLQACYYRSTQYNLDHRLNKRLLMLQISY